MKVLPRTCGILFTLPFTLFRLRALPVKSLNFSCTEALVLYSIIAIWVWSSEISNPVMMLLIKRLKTWKFLLEMLPEESIKTATSRGRLHFTKREKNKEHYVTKINCSWRCVAYRFLRLYYWILIIDKVDGRIKKSKKQKSAKNKITWLSECWSVWVLQSFSHVVRSDSFGYFDENGQSFEYLFYHLTRHSFQSPNMEKYFVRRILQDSELFRKVFYLDDGIVNISRCLFDIHTWVINHTGHRS